MAEYQQTAATKHRAASRRRASGNAKPGPKPGSRHKGMFTKGDPRINRAGCNVNGITRKTLETLCREHTESAVAFIVSLIDDPAAPENLRLRAACELLDRAHGRPVDRQVVASLSANGSGGSAASLSDAQLLAIIAGALPAPDDSANVIDLEPENDGGG